MRRILGGVSERCVGQNGSRRKSRSERTLPTKLHFHGALNGAGLGQYCAFRAGRRRHGTTFASMVVAQAREATLRDSQAARRDERRWQRRGGARRSARCPTAPASAAAAACSRCCRHLQGGRAFRSSGHEAAGSSRSCLR